MKIILSIILCTLVSAVDILDGEFRQYGIVPQFISQAPRDLLEISYPSGAKVSLGNELTPTSVKDEPRVTWLAEPDTKYTLIMSDPDAASVKGVLHWLVVNISGADVHTGRVIAEYVGSGPPQGTGLHRYIFTVFKQPGEVIFTEPYTANDSFQGRAGFNDRRFADKYNLGNPVAGNFYRAQYDEYVPILQSRFRKATPPTPAVVRTRGVPAQSVPEYIEASSGSQTFDIAIPTHQDIKATYISADHEVHRKVIQGTHLTTATPLGDSNPATSTGGPVFVPLVPERTGLTSSPDAKDSTEAILHEIIKAAENDTLVHTKVARDEYLSGEKQSVAQVTGEDREVTTETGVPTHGVIIGAYKLNDSVLRTKVLNEEDILQIKTDIFHTTETTMPQDSLIKTSFMSDDTTVHIQKLNEDELKSRRADVKDTAADSSIVEVSRIELEVSTKREIEPISEEHITTIDGTPASTVRDFATESSRPIAVEMSSNVDSAQSTERSATIMANDNKPIDTPVASVPSNESVNSSHGDQSDFSKPETPKSVQVGPTVAPSTEKTGLNPELGTVSDISSTSGESSEIVTSTPPTYETKTTISVVTGNDS